MDKRGTGVVFCTIAVVLYISRYIAAAIFGSNATLWSKALFEDMLRCVGPSMLFLSIISLIIGIAYLVKAEKSHNAKKITGTEDTDDSDEKLL